MQSETRRVEKMLDMKNWKSNLIKVAQATKKRKQARTKVIT